MTSAAHNLQSDVTTERRGRALFVTTGLLLILLFVLLNVANTTLAARFNFPDILREPPENALGLYRENFATVRFAYYLFSLTAVLTIPVSLLLRDVLKRERSVVLELATLLGVITGVVQVLGFIRWGLFGACFDHHVFRPQRQPSHQRRRAGRARSL